MTKTVEELRETYYRRWGREPKGVLIALCAACDEWIFLPGPRTGVVVEEMFNPDHIGVMPPWTVPGRSLDTVLAEVKILHNLKN